MKHNYHEQNVSPSGLTSWPFFKHGRVEFVRAKHNLNYLDLLWQVPLAGRPKYSRCPVEVACTVMHTCMKHCYLFFLQAHVDDRDYYGNKRLELAGQVCKILWCGTVAAVFKFLFTSNFIVKSESVIVFFSQWYWQKTQLWNTYCVHVVFYQL